MFHSNINVRRRTALITSVVSSYLTCDTRQKIFFFYCYVDHRYLHSFPTRRSSDLVLASPSCDTSAKSCSHASANTCWTAAKRSEEHTSELQSLTNIVCRLLLEKKKTRYPTQSRVQ